MCSNCVLTVFYSGLTKSFPVECGVIRAISSLLYLLMLTACVGKEKFDLPATDYAGFVQISSELAGTDAVFCGVGSEFPADTIVSPYYLSDEQQCWAG